MLTAQLLNGVALGSLLMVLSSGLAMIYGLRGVTNFGHGALYMAGGYLAYSVTGVMNFWAALIIVPLCLAAFGAFLELSLFRRVQDRDHIEVGLMTFAIAFILERIIVLFWGERPLSVNAPSQLGGTTTMFGFSYPSYRYFVIFAAIVMAIALVVWLNKSEVGLHVRAASQDIETASIMGINVDRVSLIVVCVGAGLAGLAGTLAAPYVSLDPGMGMTILITVLIVVMIGGTGSIGGAMIAGMGLGIIQTVGQLWSPALAVLVPYIALVAVITLRPTGLAGRRVS